MDPLEPYTGTAYTSGEPCWRCGAALWRLDPPAPGGWTFYCPTCQYLVMTRAAAEHALRDLAGPSLGVLVSWPYRLHLQPQKENKDGQSQ
jgi:hypothetical protein